MKATKENCLPSLIRELSPRETLLVTRVLDKVFDDAAGEYLAEYDDDRVAKECKVPRANVSAFRDENFGPIKKDPVLTKLDADIAKVEDRVTKAFVALSEEVSGLRDRVKKATEMRG